jgi:hypothetical protein
MSVWDDVFAERMRDHELHGPASMEAMAWNDLRRLAVLTEEVGEVARWFNERPRTTTTADVSLDALHSELVQVAAVAIAWADKVDKIKRR